VAPGRPTPGDRGDDALADSCHAVAVSTISIGGAERPLALADASWIGRAFDAQAPGELPAVRILIRALRVDMTLQTLNCGGGGGAPAGGRPLTREEAEIARLWSLAGLGSPRYGAQQVAEFVESVRHLLR
jgi:hypothetical protein